MFEAQSGDLAGTSWIVTGYNNGKQAVTSVINGTTVTAKFGSDGNVSGSGGCNSYSASYTTNGKKTIKIGPAISTQMACAQPEGVMQTGGSIYGSAQHGRHIHHRREQSMRCAPQTALSRHPSRRRRLQVPRPRKPSSTRPAPPTLTLPACSPPALRQLRVGPLVP